MTCSTARRAPRRSRSSAAPWLTIAVHAGADATASFGALALAPLRLGLDAPGAVTVTFLTLAFAQLWHVFNMRDPRSRRAAKRDHPQPVGLGRAGAVHALLAIPPYVAPLAHVLHLAPPTRNVGYDLQHKCWRRWSWRES